MSSDAIAKAITSFFATQWAAGGHTEAIASENTKYTPAPSVAYLDLEVWDGPATKASIGSGVQLRRTGGTVFVTANVPTLVGTSQPRTLCDSIATVFRDKQVATTSPTGSITFQEPSISRRGEANGMFQMKVAIPYLHECLI